MHETCCIVCDNKNNFLTYLNETEDHPNYVRCPVCGFVFADPLIPVSYSDQEEYFQHKGDVALNARLKSYQIRYDAIKKHLDSTQTRFLDVGAHTGIFLKLLKDKGMNVLGVELNKNAARFGSEHYGVEILTEPLETMTERGRFDVITLMNVFEHLVDPVTTLSHIRKLTEENGILALEVPYIFTPQVSLFRGRWHHFWAEHFWFYDKKTITKLLERNGFQVLETSFVPKVVTVAWILHMLGFVFHIYHQFPGLRYRVIEWPLYRALDKLAVKVNIHDYLLVIARRADHR